jgi:hypothetical protein
MAGLLPEKVRTRAGKGGIDSRVAWALEHERPALERAISQSRLAEMGIVDRGRLREAFDRAREGELDSVAKLLPTLALETWMAAQSAGGLTEPYREVVESVTNVSTLHHGVSYAEAHV